MYSEACERNKDFIYTALKNYLSNGTLLEMGHGTGQHAVYLSSKFPNVGWHASDLKENNWMLGEQLKSFKGQNLKGPFELKVGDERMLRQLQSQDIGPFDYLFTANTLHIMTKSEVSTFCREVGEVLKPGGYLFLYGPFKFNDAFTSESNRQFNNSLVSRGIGSCIKDFELIRNDLARTSLEFVQKYDLPANNNFLVFQKE